MVEPISALAAVFVCYTIWIFVGAMTQESPFWKLGAGVILGASALYFVIRFARWAWETPVPWAN